MMKHLIYVTEDDENIRNLICVALESFGYTTRAFETAEEALEAVRGGWREASPPSLCLTGCFREWTGWRL